MMRFCQIMVGLTLGFQLQASPCDIQDLVMKNFLLPSEQSTVAKIREAALRGNFSQKLHSDQQTRVGFRVHDTPWVISERFLRSLDRLVSKRVLTLGQLYKQYFQGHREGGLFSEVDFAILDRLAQTSPNVDFNLPNVRQVYRRPTGIFVSIDWIVPEYPLSGGDFQPRVMEVSVGNIGGVIRMALLNHAYFKLLEQQGFGDQEIYPSHHYLEEWIYAWETLLKHQADPTKVFFTENDNAPFFSGSGVKPSSNHYAEEVLRAHNYHIASAWNARQLVVPPNHQRVFLKKDGNPPAPVDLFVGFFYSSYFDPNRPGFDRLPEENRQALANHAIPGLTQAWLQNDQWHMINPFGTQFLGDKGVTALVDQVYSRAQKDVGIPSQPTFLLADHSGHLNQDIVDHVFAHLSEFVIKTRGQIGQGKGVYIGSELAGKTEEIKHLKRMIQENPESFIVQEKAILGTVDGRMIEGRSIVFYNLATGAIHPNHTIYVRSSKKGRTNLSGNTESSIIPVVVLRSQK